MIKLANLLTHPNHKAAVEVEEELRFHIDMLEGNFIRQGMSAAEAKRAAAKRFGSLERVRRQCVHISRRSGQLRRVLKTSTILVALLGLAIRSFSSDPNIARIGATLIMIAVSGRLLLYVRGLSPTARN
jgi:hypothetical protein